jgi:2-oxoglutarate dehydrogenase E1 component
MTPKSLLRHKLVHSPVEALATGGFHEVLDDPAHPERARRILLCTGKVFYDLLERRAAAKTQDVAIIRIEQLYPFAAEELLGILKPYRRAREVVWVQEESQNMGGWTFMEPRLRQLLDRPVAYVGRDASASPATGSLKIHQREQQELVEAALGGTVPHIVHSTGPRVEKSAVTGAKAISS